MWKSGKQPVLLFVMVNEAGYEMYIAELIEERIDFIGTHVSAESTSSPGEMPYMV